MKKFCGNYQFRVEKQITHLAPQNNSWAAMPATQIVRCGRWNDIPPGLGFL